MKAIDPKGSGGPLDGCFTRALLLILVVFALTRISCDALFSTQNTDFHKKAINGELLPDSTEVK